MQCNAGSFPSHLSLGFKRKVLKDCKDKDDLSDLMTE